MSTPRWLDIDFLVIANEAATAKTSLDCPFNLKQINWLFWKTIAYRLVLRWIVILVDFGLLVFKFKQKKNFADTS